VVRATLRHRERIVGSTSSTVGAHSNQIVLGVGSSIAFSSVLPVRPSPLPSRSASSTTMICHRPLDGDSAERCTSSRMSLM
jgi:hypothetical protein